MASRYVVEHLNQGWNARWCHDIVGELGPEKQGHIINEPDGTIWEVDAIDSKDGTYIEAKRSASDDPHQLQNYANRSPNRFAYWFKYPPGWPGDISDVRRLGGRVFHWNPDIGMVGCMN